MTSSDLAKFGDPRVFQIALRWAEDPEPVAARPAGYGWSFGTVRIIVAGFDLTAGNKGRQRFAGVTWYLAPFLEWVAGNWASIFHEEDFAWLERSSQPASLACRNALDRYIGTSDPRGRAAYRVSQAWYGRHALRSAATGGLFPDLFIRRFEDLVELSWTAEPPEFAPRGFFFDAAIGSVRLPVLDVSTPLWEALQWAASQPPALDPIFREDWTALSHRIDDVRQLSAADCGRASISPELYERVWSTFDAVGRRDLVEERTSPHVPVVDVFSPAVAMYGGVSPHLNTNDIETLRDRLIAATGGQDAPIVAKLVEARGDAPLGVPHKDGYAFAEDLLEDLALPAGEFVDVHQICSNLGIEVLKLPLNTDSIRGVAMAGTDFSPTILINETSTFNRTEPGQRFTIAHELCHVLFDRSRARRIAHVSGQWASPAVERRANAFAAYLLMPRDLLASAFRDMDLSNATSVRELSARLRVNASALAEHLYNLGFVDEVQRESLRNAFTIN